MTKYKAIRTNGYDSKKEAARASQLQILHAAGAISKLEEKVSFELLPKDELGRAVRYICDFRYFDPQTNATVVEDVKGIRTPVYKLKRRLMFAKHGIKIQEV